MIVMKGSQRHSKFKRERVCIDSKSCQPKSKSLPLPSKPSSSSSTLITLPPLTSRSLNSYNSKQQTVNPLSRLSQQLRRLEEANTNFKSLNTLSLLKPIPLVTTTSSGVPRITTTSSDVPHLTATSNSVPHHNTTNSNVPHLINTNEIWRNTTTSGRELGAQREVCPLRSLDMPSDISRHLELLSKTKQAQPAFASKLYLHQHWHNKERGGPINRKYSADGQSLIQRYRTRQKAHQESNLVETSLEVVQRAFDYQQQCKHELSKWKR